MYHAAESAIDWLYTIGFEYTFDEPEVVISGFALDGMAAILADVADFYARGSEFAEARMSATDDATLMLRRVDDLWIERELFLAAGWLNRGPIRVARPTSRRPTAPPGRCSHASGCRLGAVHKCEPALAGEP